MGCNLKAFGQCRRPRLEVAGLQGWSRLGRRKPTFAGVVLVSARVSLLSLRHAARPQAAKLQGCRHQAARLQAASLQAARLQAAGCALQGCKASGRKVARQKRRTWLLAAAKIANYTSCAAAFAKRRKRCTDASWHPKIATRLARLVLQRARPLIFLKNQWSKRDHML